MLTSDILTYQDFLKDTQEPIRLRLAMVKRYKETENISLVAKEFCPTRQTVRKWIKRFSGAIGSLKNCSKAPKNPYRRMDQRTEELLVQFRKEHPSLGYDYIHNYLLEKECKEIPSQAASMRYGGNRVCFPDATKNMRRKKILERSNPDTGLLKRCRSMLRS